MYLEFVEVWHGPEEKVLRRAKHRLTEPKGGPTGLGIAIARYLSSSRLPHSPFLTLKFVERSRVSR